MNIREAQEIQPGLWLGPLMAANHLPFQIQRQFSLIIRCHNPHIDIRRPLAIRQYLHRQHTIEYNIELADLHSVSIEHHFEAVIALIERYRNVRGGVLVHCDAGISRSTTLVAVYLLWQRQQAGRQYMDARGAVLDVLSEIRRLRPWVYPNPGFFRQLMNYWSSVGTKVQ